MLCYLHTSFHEAICVEHYWVVWPKWNAAFNTTHCEKLASSLFELPKETLTVALKLLFTQFLPGSVYMSLPIGSLLFYIMLVDSLAPRRYLDYPTYGPSDPSRQASVDFERECQKIIAKQAIWKWYMQNVGHLCSGAISKTPMSS